MSIPSRVIRPFRVIVSSPLAPLLLGLLLSLVVSISVAEGARYKKGDVVEVLLNGKWYEGVILDTNNRGEVLFHYQVSSIFLQRQVSVDVVRYPYEADALGKGRTWSDLSGNFRITAAALKVVDGKVTLRKEDMTTIEVPIEKLSDNDQRHLDRLQRTLGPVAAGVPEHPPLEQFAGAGAFQGGYAVSFMERETLVPIAPDPIPEYLRLQEGGAAFTTNDQSGRNYLRVILPVGGPDSWLLASVDQPHSGDIEPPTRLVWASIKKKKMENYQLLPPGEVVLDYHPPSNLLLTFNQNDRTGKNRDTKSYNLTLWKTLPTQQQAEPMIRWNADAAEYYPHGAWARIIDGEIVLQLRGANEFVGWNIKEKRVEYIVQQEAVGTKVPELSGGRKYAFLPEETQVRVFDTRTGEIITALPAPDSVWGLALNDECTQLAVRDFTNLRVWELQNPDKEPREYQAEALGGSFLSEMAWVGKDRLMVADVGSTRLFSLSKNMVIWSYKFDGATVSDSRSGHTRLRHVINDHLVYGAKVGKGLQDGFAVGNVRLPGPQVDEVDAGINAFDTTIIRPGTKVRLEVRCGDQYNHEVYTTLVEKIEKNGWILSQNEPTEVVIEADMTTDKSQSVTYVSEKSNYRETVLVTPKKSSLIIRVGTTRVWRRYTRSGGIPREIQLRNNRTAQMEVDRYQQPNPQFFHNARIPPTITDPKYKDGLGTTNVTTRGLEVK